MTRRDKLLAKMRNNPRGIRPREAGWLLRYFGFEARRSGRNHAVYSRGSARVVVSTHRDYLHPKAVKEILAVLEEFLGD